MMKKMKIAQSLLALTATSFLVGAAAPPKDRIPYQSALKIAKGKCKGKATTTSIEEEEGVWIYTFEFHDKTSKACSIVVDAITGDILEQKVEKK
jgi:uncharacterized membrane protein YkoI